MLQSFNTSFPSIEDLRARAKKRVPRFAFEYLDGGCNEDVNLHRNRSDLQSVELRPRYLIDEFSPQMETVLFGQTYSAPFGIAPIGLQGLVWPGAAQILAKAAHASGIPFVLSTVSTSSIEDIAESTEGRYWFQLYHPTRIELRDALLDRAAETGCEVLVVLSDVPSFGFRPRDIRNGLSMPPRMSIRNMAQILGRPQWALQTLREGPPSFASLEPYMPPGLDLTQLGKFMNETFSGRLTRDRLASIRDRWKGRLVVKGIAHEEDAQLAVDLGVDGIIVSNHGGRQLDAGQSSIVPMTQLASRFGSQIEVMVDSGIRSGPDIARAMASGAKFTFLGRSFMYGVGALGEEGGTHTVELLKAQLGQVMEQVGCRRTSDFPEHLVVPGSISK
jgi:L-lactate dehydrogenase (cytochrome)